MVNARCDFILFENLEKAGFRSINLKLIVNYN